MNFPMAIRTLLFLVLAVFSGFCNELGGLKGDLKDIGAAVEQKAQQKVTEVKTQAQSKVAELKEKADAELEKAKSTLPEGHHEGDGHDHGHHEGDGHDHSHDGHSEGGHHGPIKDLPFYWVLPFAILLLCIAILPLVAEHWWEENINKAKISFTLGAIVFAYLVMAHGGAGLYLIKHSMHEYFQFIVLLSSLYIISGGIVFRGTLAPTPALNTAILSFGALIASFVGTTGASMLLIRPLLKANVGRKHVVHTVVFFIFMVSNIGGCLTPLGDPPLFLGFLKGIPFSWTFSLWKEWLFVNIILAIVYFIWDSMYYRKEEFLEEDLQQEKEPIKVEGLMNFVWLGGVVACVAFGTPDKFHALGLPADTREVIMIGFIILSLVLTDKKLREANEFNYHPINEVAFLFVGIFLTMIPAINTLKIMGPTLGVEKTWHFFWGTGILSSFLDNAPTYVVFLELANSLRLEGLFSPELGALIGEKAILVPNDILTAISLGAVFMGANSYIGNGPNFMVKAIAEQSGVRMPSFFGYMMYSFGILVPIFLVVTFIWF